MPQDSKNTHSRLRQPSSQLHSSSTTIAQSVWAQLLNKAPQIRNATYYYTHSVIQETTDAIGHLATKMHQQIARNEDGKRKSVTDTGLYFPEKSITTTSRFSQSNGATITSAIDFRSKGAEVNSVEFSQSTEAVINSSRSTVRSSAAAVASAATKATASIATGLYNALSPNCIPEVLYCPGEAMYGSPSNIFKKTTEAEISYQTEISHKHKKNEQGEKLFERNGITNHQNFTPSSFQVTSASVQVITSNEASTSLLDNGIQSGDRFTPTEVSSATYLSLALRDGMAVYEIDETGVHEVIAHLKDDPVVKNMLLKHELGADETEHIAGTPPQPVPRQILDVRVIETSSQWENQTIHNKSPVEKLSNSHIGTPQERTVTITSQIPIITIAILTDTFNHYYADKKNLTTACDQHQRVMIVQCVPRCVFAGDPFSASSKRAPNHCRDSENMNDNFDFFVPLTCETEQQQVLLTQSMGAPYPPFLKKITRVNAGLVYRIVAHHTFVNSTPLKELSTFPSQRGSVSNITSECIGLLTDKIIDDKGDAFAKREKESVHKKLVLLGFQTKQNEGCDTFFSNGKFSRGCVILREAKIQNGAHASSGKLIALACPLTPSASDTVSQTYLRAELAQTNTEYYAKAATSSLSKLGSYLGFLGEKPSNFEEDTQNVSDGNSSEKHMNINSHGTQNQNSNGFVTICDLSLLPWQPTSMSITGDFASFAAHSHPIQVMALDPSGTMLATASTQGTSVNVYQITRIRQSRSRSGNETFNSLHFIRTNAQEATLCKCKLGSNSKDFENRKLSDDDNKEIKNGNFGTKNGLSVPSLVNSHSTFIGEITLLYRLLRGKTTANISSLCFSPLSLAVGVSSSVGTCHFYYLDDHHASQRESSEQLAYFNATHIEKNVHINTLQIKNEELIKRPFTCFRVGVRGELSVLRKAPMIEPICRARSSICNPQPWPLVSFRNLPLFRTDTIVETLARKKHHVDPNLLGGSTAPEFTAATFDACLVCPASLSVTYLQFCSNGNAEILFTCSLPDFFGPKWLSVPLASKHRTAASEMISEHETISCQDIGWLLQQERHCARSSDYSWAHIGSFTYRAKRGNPNVSQNIVYRCDEQKYPFFDRHSHILTQLDDAEEDVSAAKAVENEEWDATNYTYVEFCNEAAESNEGYDIIAV